MKIKFHLVFQKYFRIHVKIILFFLYSKCLSCTYSFLKLNLLCAFFLSFHSLIVSLALRDLYNSMDKKPGGAIPPMIFIQVLHMAYPQFAEKSEHGGFAQQVKYLCTDIEEEILARNI